MSVHPSSNRTRGYVYVARFLAGRPLDGVRRTDATWLNRATRDLTVHGRTAVWHHLPGWHRTLWRIGIALIVLGTIYGYIQNRTLTFYGLIGFTVCLLILTVLYIRSKVKNHKHHKRVVRPLYRMFSNATGTASVFGHAHGDNHKRYINVPRNYRDDKKTRIKLIVPDTWETSRANQQRLMSIITQKLGGDWDYAPHLSEWPPYVEFYPSPAPPDHLVFEQFKRALDEGNTDKIIIGMGTHEKVISIDLNSESPHIAISMGTGGGKTSLMRLIISYLIHHGCERIDIIDPKRLSHNWAKDIPNVYIHKTVAKQIEIVHNFRLRMESRYDALDTDDTITFPRHVLIIEEQNSWIQAVQDFWSDYRAELEPKDRAKITRKCPAISDLGFILYQGRQANMNVFSIFQRMSAGASGGGDMRENYGAKILARYSPQTWKILVGTTPVPRSSKINGRARYILADTDHQIQMPFITDKEAQEYALVGISPIIPDPEKAPIPDHDSPISLREAVDADIIPMRLGALKKARARAGNHFAPGIKTPVGILYKPSDLKTWHDNRNKKAA